jgi:hypothetical protein
LPLLALSPSTTKLTSESLTAAPCLLPGRYPWIEWIKSGVGVHGGGCDAWKKTPHEVFLAWFRDAPGMLPEHGIVLPFGNLAATLAY